MNSPGRAGRTAVFGIKSSACETAFYTAAGSARRLAGARKLWKNGSNSTDWMVTAMIDRDGYRPNVAIVLVNQQEPGLLGQAHQGARLAVPPGRHQAGGDPPSRRCTGSSRRKRDSKPQHVEILGRTRDWLHYNVPNHWVKREWRGTYKGQKQIWFLLRLVGPRHATSALRASGHPGVRRVALARLLGAARDGDRLQARGLPHGAGAARRLPRGGRAPARRHLAVRTAAPAAALTPGGGRFRLIGAPADEEGPSSPGTGGHFPQEWRYGMAAPRPNSPLLTALMIASMTMGVDS